MQVQNVFPKERYGEITQGMQEYLMGKFILQLKLKENQQQGTCVHAVYSKLHIKSKEFF